VVVEVLLELQDGLSCVVEAGVGVPSQYALVRPTPLQAGQYGDRPTRL